MMEKRSIIYLTLVTLETLEGQRSAFKNSKGFNKNSDQ